MLKIKITFIIVLCLLTSPIGISAQYYNVWRVAYNGTLDFNHEPPKVTYTAVAQNETNPTVSISDSSGRLLFWNTPNYTCNIIPKAMAGNPSYKGNFSNQQNLLILPSFNNNNQYKVFLSNASAQSPGGNNIPISYHTVDMSLEKGLGKVIDSPGKIIYPAYCKSLTAVRNKTRSGYWLIGRQNDTIFAIEYTVKGFGKPIKNIIPCPKAELSGNLKASHDGEFFIELAYNAIYSYSFNTATGIFSNQKLIDIPIQNSGSLKDTNFKVHDVAFSPNDSFFYTIDIIYYYSNDIDTRAKEGVLRSINQYQRFASDIAKSSYRLSFRHKSQRQCSGIQLAPNGKIYFYHRRAMESNAPDSMFLGVIKHPDRLGPKCGFQLNEIAFPATAEPGQMGLPFFLSDGQFAKFTYGYNCGISFKNMSHEIFTRFQWYFGDGDTAAEKEPIHNYANPGKYYVKLKAITPKGYTAWYTDSIEVIPTYPIPDFKFSDTVVCPYLPIQFNDLSTADTINSNTGEKWLWDFGDGSPPDTNKNPIHYYTKNGEYQVTLAYCNGFSFVKFTHPIKIKVLPGPEPGLSPNIHNGCALLSVIFKDESKGKVKKYFYDFGNGMTDTVAEPKIIYSQPGIYKVVKTLTGSNDCKSKDSVLIKVYPNFSASDIVEIAGTTVLENGNTFTSWISKPNAAEYHLYKSTDGNNYKLTAAIKNDTSFEDKNVETSKSSYYYKLKATDSCGNESGWSRIAKSVHLKGTAQTNEFALLQWTAYEDWPQGVKDYTLEVKNDSANFISFLQMNQLHYKDDDFTKDEQKQEKCYRIKATSYHGPESYSNEVCLPYLPVLLVPSAFTPNGDELNDTFNISAIGIASVSIIIYDRWGGEVFKSNASGNGWDGTVNTEKAPPGEYLFFISAKDNRQNNIFLKGSVQLIR